jgi:hypothetical protein
LTPDAPEVLDNYSQRSPIFMAARFDAASAGARGQRAGDGTPIHLTIPVDRPWVPLRILALGRDPSSVVQADVFLLTDRRPQLLTGDPGLRLAVGAPASAPLLDDLRSDKGMEWVPQQQWLSYLKIDTPAGQLTHDLAMSVDPQHAPSRIDAGISTPADVLNTLTGARPHSWTFPLVAAAVAAVGATTISVGWTRRRATAR